MNHSYQGSTKEGEPDHEQKEADTKSSKAESNLDRPTGKAARKAGRTDHDEQKHYHVQGILDERHAEKLLGLQARSVTNEMLANACQTFPFTTLGIARIFFEKSGRIASGNPSGNPKSVPKRELIRP